jgi:hypothetical protein
MSSLSIIDSESPERWVIGKLAVLTHASAQR